MPVRWKSLALPALLAELIVTSHEISDVDAPTRPFRLRTCRRRDRSRRPDRRGGQRRRRDGLVDVAQSMPYCSGQRPDGT
jgi:hypothetical protein